MIINNHVKILSSLKTMNFDLFLNNNPEIKIYPNNSIIAFTKKLNNIFEILKSKGDSFLNIKNCTCICEGCKKDYPNKFIYAFVGNVSADFFALTINVNKTNDSIFITITPESQYDIYAENYKILEFDESAIGQKFGDVHGFTITDDELDDFICDDEYLDIISKRDKALCDLEIIDNKFNNYNELINWLTIYKIENVKNGCNYIVLEDFNKLYMKLDAYANICKHIPRAKNAIRDTYYNNIDNKELLLQWLIKYEDFYFDNLSRFSLDIWEEKTNFLSFEFNKIYKLSLNIFEEIVPFVKVFSEFYYPELERIRNDYFKQQNITLEEFESKCAYIKNELTHFNYLINQ
jgi:hypothetical protein